MERTPFDVLREKNLKKANMMPDPEANPYAGTEYRMPNQFGEVGINPYHNEVLTEDQLTPDEVDSLKARGAEFPLVVKVPEVIFPYETGEGVKYYGK